MKAIWTPGYIQSENGSIYSLCKDILSAPKGTFLFCHGHGGSISDANAAVSAILAHGDIVGVLCGNAQSAHTCLFAACQERWVFPQSVLSFHAPYWNLDGKFTSQSLEEHHRDVLFSVHQAAKLLADRSDKSFQWWLKKIQSTQYSMYNMDEDEIAAVGLAKKIDSDFIKTMNDLEFLDQAYLAVSENG